jgi:PAS domain S-box-containing protein
VCDSKGVPIGLIGVTRDITSRKRAEQALAERSLLLALAGKSARVGSYTYDAAADVMQVSDGYVAVHGLPEGTKETTRTEWKARAHPEDLDRVVQMRERAFRERSSEYSTEYRIVRASGEIRWVETRSFISYDRKGLPQRVVGVNIDITERKRGEEHRSFLNAELDHRVKNVLATVGAIIAQMQNDNRSIVDFVATVESRIKSLASTHELLSRSQWHGASLEEIIGGALAAYPRSNVEVGGPGIMLRPAAAQATAMVFHELITNAAKYGALSRPSGRLSVRWDWSPKSLSQRRLSIEWQETGGPPVSGSGQPGFGTQVIRELIPYEVAGTVDLTFAPGGVRCRLELPADSTTTR